MQRQFLDAMLSGVLPYHAAVQAGYDAPAMAAWQATQSPGWREVCDAAWASSMLKLKADGVKNLTVLMESAERETVRLDATKYALQLAGVQSLAQDGESLDLDTLAKQVLKTIDDLPDRAVPIGESTHSAIDAAVASDMSKLHVKRGRPRKNTGT